jgi:hypothetical protein
MPASDSEVLVGRRYLERGFLDAAMKLFIRNAELVTPADWGRLGERLMERNRIPDVVRICELGGVPLPRERMLAAGDAMTSLPDRARQAVEIVERHLTPEIRNEPAAPRLIQAVK